MYIKMEDKPAPDKINIIISDKTLRTMIDTVGRYFENALIIELNDLTDDVKNKEVTSIEAAGLLFELIDNHNETSNAMTALQSFRYYALDMDTRPNFKEIKKANAYTDRRLLDAKERNYKPADFLEYLETWHDEDPNIIIEFLLNVAEYWTDEFNNLADIIRKHNYNIENLWENVWNTPHIDTLPPAQRFARIQIEARMRAEELEEEGYWLEPDPLSDSDLE